MRKKEVSIDDVSFTISPLDLDQVDEFVAGKNAVNILDVVRMGLNNAKPETEWTTATLRKEIDLVVRQRLFDEVMELSGLGKTGPVGVVRQGEDRAASAS